MQNNSLQINPGFNNSTQQRTHVGANGLHFLTFKPFSVESKETVISGKIYSAADYD